MLNYVDDFTDQQFRVRTLIHRALDRPAAGEDPVTWEDITADLLNLYPRQAYDASITVATLESHCQDFAARQQVPTEDEYMAFDRDFEFQSGVLIWRGLIGNEDTSRLYAKALQVFLPILITNLRQREVAAGIPPNVQKLHTVDEPRKELMNWF